jgi:hypothetical protein
MPPVHPADNEGYGRDRCRVIYSTTQSRLGSFSSNRFRS